MEKKTLVFVAEDIAAAFEKATYQVPKGWTILKKDILSNGQPKTLNIETESIEKAWEKATEQVPPDSHILERRIIREPGQRSIEISASSQKDAEEAASTELLMTSGESIISSELKAPGKNGFLGFGARKSLYRINIVRTASVQLIFSEKVRVAVEIGDEEALKAESQKQLNKLVESLKNLDAIASRIWDMFESRMALADSVGIHGLAETIIEAHEAVIQAQLIEPFNSLLEEAKRLLQDLHPLQDFKALSSNPSKVVWELSWSRSASGYFPWSRSAWTLQKDLNLVKNACEQLKQLLSTCTPK